MSFFGEMLDSMVVEIKNHAIDLNFDKKIDGTVEDLNKIIDVAIETSMDARNPNHDEGENLAFFQENTDEPALPDEPPDPTDPFDEIDIDSLIGESYIHGKSDEQIANEFVDDLHEVVKNYAWLFVALGAKMQATRDAELIAKLTKRSK